MELVNKVLVHNITSKQIVSFPVDAIDTSWMTKSQKKFFEILKNDENKNKKYYEICKLAGYKTSGPWYKAIKDERFADLLKSIGFDSRLYNEHYPSHNEVEYIKNPTERDEYLKSDVWDMRRLFEKYPRHNNPCKFIVNFNTIENKAIRNIIKRYFINMLSNWQPVTFNFYIKVISPFFTAMNELFPNINSLDKLKRESHIEPILKRTTWSNYYKKEGLTAIKSMFDYMYYNKWDNAPSFGLLNKYDTPKLEETIPRPIPPNIKIQLDDYIEDVVIPLLEDNQPTPIIEPQYWDLIIVIRNTGRRFEDICHLIAEHKDKSKECLQYDLDGDPMLYLDHHIAKIPKDLRIPLAHLTDSKGNNIVERAILRQMERVKEIAPTPDGYRYLFREIKIDNRGLGTRKAVLDNNGISVIDSIRYDMFNNAKILPSICDKIPLKNIDGSVYKISAHQFRHTVATEMIDAGVDIYAVKEFLGHSSVAMTEKYIKIYQQRLKKEFKEKLSQSYATDIKNNLSEQEDLYDNKWVKNKIIGVFELGDGCCEHPYKMPSCPHMACKTCFKKKIYPRHLQAVKDTIESETIHRDNALRMGLNEKAEEFDKIVRFYAVALEIINKGEIFEASKHFYIKGVK
ncbi:tyrosine-type recombinase/integrase [Clostridium perfringens]|uniref:Site-specific recombinase, phage integrase family n=1 Tax=Clostridium perfringens TaxID=1502 RepID=A0A133N0Y0_CLOPF|nr:site-specific integrase [Clostridium perfringens]KXA09929.1 site-specific recombinase, phage integrase family [Clostridium perfringens]MBS5921482.1 site-specific integrase [Clostridium perfringens]